MPSVSPAIVLSSFGIGDDVSEDDFLALSAVLAAHEAEGADALFGLFVDVVDRLVARQLTGEDLDERKLSNVWVDHDFEDEGEELAVLIRRDVDGLVSVERRAVEHILRRRHVVADHIHELGDADVERAGTGDDREERTGADGLAQYAEKLFKRELFAVEVTHHELVVGFNRSLDERLARGGYRIRHVGRRFAFGKLFTAVALVHIGFSGEDVDEALEVLLLAYRQVERHGLVRDVFLYICHDVVKVGMFSVKFADERRSPEFQKSRRIPTRCGFVLQPRRSR